MRRGRARGSRKKRLTPDLRFALKLARTLGRTLEELGHTMSAEEFALHVADYEREPWGDERNAMELAAVRRSVHIGPLVRPPEMSECQLKFVRDSEVPEQSEDEFLRSIGAL